VTVGPNPHNAPRTETPATVISDDTRRLLDGASKMITTALEIELDVYLAQHHRLVDSRGRRLVVRNGYRTIRAVRTVLGEVAVQAPRLLDRRGDGTGYRDHRFESIVIPPWKRLPTEFVWKSPLHVAALLDGADSASVFASVLGPSDSWPRDAILRADAWRNRAHESFALDAKEHGAAASNAHI
jgi:hypothetical protein